ncbi:MAG: alpha/beta fold hydrolase [Candidatus Acidiferrales bacterium]
MRSPSTPSARRRLFCLPNAGGGTAVFSGWSKLLGPEVEVCCLLLPGRENRFRERSFEHMPELVPAIAEGMRDYLDKPFSFFGHSLGGIICFELVRYFRSHCRWTPDHLFVSSARAPQLPNPFSRILSLPEPEFIEEVGRRYGAIPEEVLADEELRRLTLPMLRADFSVFETYEYSDGPPLECAIFAFGGQQDSMVSRESLEAWREQTSGAFTARLLPGGHFYLRDEKLRLLGQVRELLKSNAI